MQIACGKLLLTIGICEFLGHATVRTPMSRILLCVCFLSVLCIDMSVSSSFLAVRQAQCSLTDFNVLREFQTAINSSELSSWSTHNNCCLWMGVSCNSEGQVIALDLRSLSLTGTIPPILSELSALQSLNLSNNLFGGRIPPSFADLSRLTSLDLSHNKFLMDPLPAQLPPRLRHLDISHCAYHGMVFGSITNSSSIEELFINGNYFSSFAMDSNAPLAALRSLDASDNLLASDSLQFLLNCTRLRYLSLRRNRLQGEMPSQLSALAYLEILQLQENLLTGPIPPVIGACIRMKELWLDDNYLYGLIPETLGNLSMLTVLSIANNSFEGPFPKAIVKCTLLRYLSLSGNMLYGNIPADLGSLKHLEVLLLARNRFSGSVLLDRQFLTQLEVFDEWNNREEGSILSETMEAKAKPLYGDRLTSRPKHWQRLVRRFLYFIHVCNTKVKKWVSYRSQKSQDSMLESVMELVSCCKVVKQDHLKVFLEETARVHNYRLLQGSEDLNDGSKSINLILIGVLSGVIVFFTVALIVAIMIFCRLKYRPWRRTQPRQAVVKISSLRKFQRESSRVFDPTLASVSMRDLFKATDGFNLSRVVGDGGFGLVYSATLADGRMVAVKKLCIDGIQGTREFEAEMETIGKIKHPNLVELLAYCMAANERVLVYELVQYGSLDTWLHEKEDGPGHLTWNTRLKIALGSARGLSYLHHESNPHVIHRDIKSSNILLGKDFEPKIADFGLARVLSPYISHVSTDAAGTLGYMAPEYATTLAATKQADVYSFGMVMLELGSCRRPNLLVQEKNFRSLARWARHMLQLGYEKDVLDSVFSKMPPPSNQVRAYFAVACDCVRECPSERPTMREVYERLSLIGQAD